MFHMTSMKVGAHPAPPGLLQCLAPAEVLKHCMKKGRKEGRKIRSKKIRITLLKVQVLKWK